MSESIILGIDVGATGIKGALVDISSGELITERTKLKTPDIKTPEAILSSVVELANIISPGKSYPMGLGFPSVIIDGVCKTAANIDNSWIGQNIQGMMSAKFASPVTVINDADAAGLAEIHYCSAAEKEGKVIFLTLGSGIGSSIFIDGKLFKNSELGHILFEGDIAERSVSNSARKRRDLSWEDFGRELGEYLLYLNGLFYPKLFILGGGISKKHSLYAPYIDSSISVRPAKKYNNSGIIGAALAHHLA